MVKRLVSSCQVYVGAVKSAFEDVNVGSFLTFCPTVVEDQIEAPTPFH